MRATSVRLVRIAVVGSCATAASARLKKCPLHSPLASVVLTLFIIGCSQPDASPRQEVPVRNIPPSPGTVEHAVYVVEKLEGTVSRDTKGGVIEVNLGYANFTDAGLKDIVILKNLTALHLFGTNVTDVGLRELSNFKQLTVLSLDSTEVTNAGLYELASLKNLTTLTLTNTNVTDAGLKELAHFKQLTTLDLSDTKVTDVGLKEIANLKQLKQLGLRTTLVTDGGVVDLLKILPNCSVY